MYNAHKNSTRLIGLVFLLLVLLTPACAPASEEIDVQATIEAAVEATVQVTATNTPTATPEPPTPIPPSPTNTKTATPEPPTPIPPSATNTKTATPEPSNTPTPIPPSPTQDSFLDDFETSITRSMWSYLPDPDINACFIFRPEGEVISYFLTLRYDVWLEDDVVDIIDTQGTWHISNDGKIRATIQYENGPEVQEFTIVDEDTLLLGEAHYHRTVICPLLE